MSKNKNSVSPFSVETVSKTVPVDNSVVSNSIESIDRINNSEQKEGKLFVSGVTRVKYMAVIAEAFDAVKEVELVRGDGSYYKDTVPDVARRQWACERSIELFGDKVTKVENVVKADLSENDRAILEKLTFGDKAGKR